MDGGLTTGRAGSVSDRRISPSLNPPVADAPDSPKLRGCIGIAMAGVETSWKAGVATTVITPAESMWLAGWAVRTEPSRGTLADLYAKALALQDHEGSRLVL